MKRVLFLFLVFSAAAGAFAQLSWRLEADLNVRLASWLLPTGEKTEKAIKVGDDTLFNSDSSNPGAWSPGGNRGDYIYSAGSFDLFNYYRFTTKENTLRLIFDCRNELVSFFVSTNLDNLIRANIQENQGSGGNELTGGHSFVQGNGRSPNWGDLLRYSFEAWHIKGNFMILSGFVGTTQNRGKVSGLNSISWDIMTGILVNDYGVTTPDANANFNEHGLDANNLAVPPRIVGPNNDVAYFYDYMPYMMAEVALARFDIPLTFQVAADAGNNNFFLKDGAQTNYRNFGGAVRISGENIGGRLTFDTIYKFRGGDPDTLDDYNEYYNPGGTRQPNGTGKSSHVFGAYANILGIRNVNIGLGYTGFMRVFEDLLVRDTEETVSTSGPLFQGIDLRFQYTGFRDKTLTWHTNVSFAGTDTSSDTQTIIGVMGQPLARTTLGEYSQDWLGLYNAFGFNFRLNNQVWGLVDLVSRYGLITTSVSPTDGRSDYTIKRSHLRLGAGGYVAFQANQNLLFQAGVVLVYLNNAYYNTADGAQSVGATRDASGGTFEFSIPLRMRVNFVPGA